MSWSFLVVSQFNFSVLLLFNDIKDQAKDLLDRVSSLIKDTAGR